MQKTKRIRIKNWKKKKDVNWKCIFVSFLIKTLYLCIFNVLLFYGIIKTFISRIFTIKKNFLSPIYISMSWYRFWYFYFQYQILFLMCFLLILESFLESSSRSVFLFSQLICVIMFICLYVFKCIHGIPHSFFRYPEKLILDLATCFHQISAIQLWKCYTNRNNMCGLTFAWHWKC